MRWGSRAGRQGMIGRAPDLDAGRWWRGLSLGGRPVHRRTVLRGVLGGAAVFLGLPVLEAFLSRNGDAYACGGVIPKRFGLFFWGNGNRPERWVPTGEGTDWELSEELAPLLNIKHKVSVISGMSIKHPNVFPHTSGVAGLLTGVAPSSEIEDGSIRAPTIDQIIAQQIGGDTIWRSIQTTPTGSSGVSYNGLHSQNPPEASPYALFERIFGSSFRAPGDSAAVDPTLALRQSVLDAVLEDANRLKAQVGRADQARLEAHMDGVREIETRLARLQEDPPQLDACVPPDAPAEDYPDIDGRPQISAKSRAMCDMLAMAMACDQTRVFGHYLSDPVSGTLFTGTSAGHHDLTHNEAEPQEEVHQITVQIMQEYAYLLEKMDSVQEGDETLLDNSVVLGCSEVSLGKTHSLDDMPIVYGGTACGRLQQGVHYRSYTAENVSKVMLSLIRAMDITAASFGEAEAEVSDGLAAMEV